MARAATSYANFEQVLFYLDGPQLITLAAGKSKIVAVATGKISDREFFGAKVSLKQLSEYLNERFDLLYLITEADRKAWYRFDLPRFGTHIVELTEAPLEYAVEHDLLPDHGLFARHHTIEYQAVIFEAQRSVQRFGVDGNWDMREFSKFHSSISDLYALTRSIDLFVDPQVSDERKRKVMQSFVKPWEGGGSYFGFFRSLASAGGREYRPDIQAIQWASPGYIDVVGDQDSFDRLLRLMSHYAASEKLVDEDYEHLWSYLQENKLLKRNTTRLDRRSDVAVEVGERARSLSRSLAVTQYRIIKRMAGNDPVVAAKVLLATKRRLDRLYRFFAEGRATVSDERVAPRGRAAIATSVS